MTVGSLRKLILVPGLYDQCRTQQRLKQASDARAQEVAGSEVLYSGDANLTDEQIAKLPFALYRQGYEYYWKTHAHPNIFRSVRDIVPSKRWLL
ncbi:TPA: hypothetical protein ACUK57_002346 [Escherichia coli]